LIDWLFNGTSTQKGQFVPTAGGDYLSRLRMANEIQCTLPYVTPLQDNNVTQFTVKHSSYMNATTGYLRTYLLSNTLAPSPIPSQIPLTLFDIISLGEYAVLCHDQVRSRFNNLLLTSLFIKSVTHIMAQYQEILYYTTVVSLCMI